MLRASVGLSASGSSEPVIRACHVAVRRCSAGDAVHDRASADGVVGHEGVGVQRADAEVGLGQHHPHVVDHACGRTASRSYIRAQQGDGVGVGRRRGHRTRDPQPYQPGSISRHCVQPNTHGIARRSSMRSEPVRDAGRLPTLSDEISPIGVIARKNSTNARLVVARARGRRRARASDSSSIAASKRSRVGAEVVVDARRRLERGGDEGLEVAPGRRRLGVLGGDHLALLGDAQLAVDRAGRLGQDRLVGRPAAAADGAAAAVEQPQPHARAPGPRRRARSCASDSAQLAVR